jgi:hypothetical protein
MMMQQDNIAVTAGQAQTHFMGHVHPFQLMKVNNVMERKEHGYSR